MACSSQAGQQTLQMHWIKVAEHVCASTHLPPSKSRVWYVCMQIRITVIYKCCLCRKVVMQTLRQTCIPMSIAGASVVVIKVAGVAVTIASAVGA